MSFGVSDHDEKVLESLDRPMEYGGVEEGGYNPENDEMNPDQAFNKVRNAIPMVQQETDNGLIEVFDQETADYNLATAVLIDDKNLKEQGVIRMQRENLIRTGESPIIKEQRDLLTKARDSIGYVDLQARIQSGEGSTLDKQMMTGWNAIELQMQKPPKREAALETYRAYKEKHSGDNASV